MAPDAPSLVLSGLSYVNSTAASAANGAVLVGSVVANLTKSTFALVKGAYGPEPAPSLEPVFVADSEVEPAYNTSSTTTADFSVGPTDASATDASYSGLSNGDDSGDDDYEDAEDGGPTHTEAADGNNNPPTNPIHTTAVDGQ